MTITPTASGLHSAIQTAIDEGRVGRPQFLRCIVSVGDSGKIDSALRELMGLASDIFGSESIQSHSQGDPDVYRSEMLKWQGSQGALLIVNAGVPYVDLMLLGSRGTLYHEG